MGHPAPATLAKVDTLDNLYPMMSELNITCGWHRPAPALWPEPKKNFVPFQWRYAHAKAALDAAGRLIDTALAERRNLILFNPIEGNHYATARTIISAYQMVLPGEIARSHRHVPNALRFVLDAEAGMFTVVNGEALEMLPGDVLLTPNWCWHGHNNEGQAPAYWLDFLDVPLVQLLEPMFFEHYPTQYEPVRDKPRQSPFVFKWIESEKRLADATDTPHYGHQIEFGDPAMDTLGLFMQRLGRGRTTERLQTTANNVYAVFRGRGTTEVDGERFEWSKGDVIVAPGWRAHHHAVHEDAVLFRVTDAPVQQRLGLLRTAH
ncbi:MAG: cupin domain-containing protein [Burkholderiales bacterium]